MSFLSNVTSLESSMRADVKSVRRAMFSVMMELMASALSRYYTPLLVLLGSLGNLLSVFVFFNSNLHVQSTSQYLSALAVSDTLFLLLLLPPWLNAVNISDVFNYFGICQMTEYTCYVSSCVSAWLVVGFTVERFVAVLYPLRRHMLCTVQRARFIIAAIAGSAMLVNLPVLRFVAPANNTCDIDIEYMEHAERFNIADTVISFTIPLAVIIIMNITIIMGFFRVEPARRQLREETDPRRWAHCITPMLTGSQRYQQRVTRMLLIVSSVFVMFNVPAYTLRILAYTLDVGNNDMGLRWAALQQVAVQFFNTNFGINFILYCLSGQNFRRALIQTLPWLCTRRSRPGPGHRKSCRRPAVATTGSTTLETQADGGSPAPATRRRPCPCMADLIRDRPGRRLSYIQRWTFDNSRQRRSGSPVAVEEIEMDVFSNIVTISTP